MSDFIILNEITEWKRLDGGEDTIVSGSLEEVSCLWLLGLTLEVYLDSSLCSLGLGCFVVLLTLQNFLLTLGLSNVLDANMDTLFDNSSINKLVDTDTNGTLCYIKDDSSSTVVSLVGHTLVDGGISENINIVSNLDIHQVLRKVNGSMLPELLGKHVARARSDSV